MNTTQLTECPSSQTERLPFSRGKIRVLAVAIAVFSSLIGSSLAQQVVPSFSKAFSPPKNCNSFARWKSGSLVAFSKS